MTSEEEATATILPFYVLVDVSWSMTQDFGDMTGIEAVNLIAPEIAELFDSKPVIRDKIRFALMSFAGEAKLEIPLCDIGDLDSHAIPTLEERTDGTSYSDAFRALRQQIDLDVATLKAGNHFKVHRPAVFFLTDGVPTDSAEDWQAAFEELAGPDNHARPNFIPFGVQDADKSVLDQLARYKTKTGQQPRSFVQSKEITASAAINSMLTMLTNSIVQSAQNLADSASAGQFHLPEPEDDDSAEVDDWL